MGNTPVYGWPYHELTDPPDGAALGKNLAEAIEASVSRIDGVFIRKSANEQRQGTTVFSDDAELLFNVEAGASYVFDLVLYLSNSGTSGNGDFQMRFAFPAGTLDYSVVGPEVPIGSTSQGQVNWGGKIGNTVSPSAVAQCGCSQVADLPLPVKVAGTFVATDPGTVRLQWAQINASFTTTMHAGSYLAGRRVA